MTDLMIIRKIDATLSKGKMSWYQLYQIVLYLDTLLNFFKGEELVKWMCDESNKAISEHFGGKENG